MDSKRIAAIIVLLAVLLAVAAVAVTSEPSEKKDVSGPYYLAMMTEGTFTDSPMTISRGYAEGESETVNVSLSGDGETICFDHNGKELRLYYSGSSYHGTNYIDSGPVMYAGRVVDSNTITLSYIISEKQIAYSLELVRCGTVSEAELKSSGLFLEEWQTVTASNVSTTVAERQADDPSQYTLTYLRATGGMIFYQITTPSSSAPVNCIGIHTYDMNSFASVYRLEGKDMIDYIYSEPGYTNLSSAMKAEDGSIEVWSVDYVQDDRVLIYPDINGAVYTGTQRTYTDGGAAAEKDMTVNIRQECGSIAFMENSFGTDTSEWGASIVPVQNGYRLQIFGLFSEDGKDYQGCYKGTLTKDLREFSIIAFSSSGTSSQIGFADLGKEDQ